MTDPSLTPPVPRSRLAFFLERLIPDTRLLVMAGMFALAWKILVMIERTPSLLGNAAFMTVVTLIMGGSGLGAVVAFQFGGTKTGSAVMEAQSAAVIASTPPPTNPPPTQ